MSLRRVSQRVELYGQSSGTSYVSQGDPTIPGATSSAYNNGSDFGALFTNNWDNTGAKPDWAFNATFTAGSGDALTLEATIHRQGGRRFVALTWSPADGGTVNVLRNGDVIATTDDDGEVRDSLGTGTGIFIYQVCETDSGDCSNAVRVKVGGQRIEALGNHRPKPSSRRKQTPRWRDPLWQLPVRCEAVNAMLLNEFLRSIRRSRNRRLATERSNEGDDRVKGCAKEYVRSARRKRTLVWDHFSRQSSMPALGQSSASRFGARTNSA